MADPRALEALWQASIQHQSRGEWAMARQCLERLLLQSPGHPDALAALAVVALREGALDEALTLARDACQRDRRHPGLLLNLGLVQETRGELADAAATYRKVLRLAPQMAEAHRNLGNTLLKSADVAGAVAALRRADALRPGDPQLLTHLANALAEAGRDDEAAAAYRSALARDGTLQDALIGLGSLQVQAGHLSEAAALYRRVLSTAPGDADALLALGAIALLLGDFSGACVQMRTAIEARPGFDQARTNYLAALNFDPASTQAAIASGTRWAVRDIEAEGSAFRDGRPAMVRRVHAGGERIRVGFVSGDLGQHSVSHFVAPVFEHLDRTRFEVLAYPTRRRTDPVAERLKSWADHWHPIDGLGDDAAAQRIADDRVDVLVDLAGHTRGERLRVFARRPAAVQLSWCGYPNTTGLSAIDWRITDAIADPQGEDESLHSERLYRMPGGFLCYAPPTGAPVPARSMRDARIVFGSFNNASKLSVGTLQAWSAVLAAVPDASLLLKAGNLEHAEVRSALLARCAAAGIDPARVTCEPMLVSVDEHLARYGAIDIALDTFPYNGTTTTCEALWMGVPVVTLAGNRHAARVGASLLDAAGLGAQVAHDIPAFVSIAAALAADPLRLASIRTMQRTQLMASRLLDARDFALRFGQALESMLVAAPRV